MALTWKLSEIRTRWREDTGLSQVADISNESIDDIIIDYYVNHFPHDARVAEFDSFIEQITAATDLGKYSLMPGIDRLDDPVTVNRTEIRLYRDRERFFSDYPEDEQFITDPTLVIGTDTKKVKHSDFTYRIQNYSYLKAASEVDLTGPTIPQNKYGAWSLRIDNDGGINVDAALGNEDGYDTPRMALEALSNSDSTTAYMGYVTAMSIAAGGFIPATTELNDADVTATYTDGKFELRNIPGAILLYGAELYARPKPNDIYLIKAPSIADRPTAFADDDAVPADPKWGPAIARGAAIMYLEPRGGQKRITDLAVTTKHYFGSIRSDKIKRLLGSPVQRSF